MLKKEEKFKKGDKFDIGLSMEIEVIEIGRKLIKIKGKHILCGEEERWIYPKELSEYLKKYNK